MHQVPFFTIITASFNSEKTICKTIESLLNQSFKNFEYLLIDGKSTDKTVEIIKNFEPRFKEKGITYKWISEKDSGIYYAFNKGLNLANGNWISFLGSDDYYTENALKLYNNAIISSEKSIDLCYSKVQIVTEEKNVSVINETWKWSVFKKYMNIPHVGSFHNKDYFKKYGNFNETFKIAGDYELLLRANKTLKTLKVDEITTFMSENGVSNNQVSKVFKETFKAKQQTGKRNVLLCTIDYLIAIAKYFTKKTIHAFTR